jgi:hypothetical protein
MGTKNTMREFFAQKGIMKKKKMTDVIRNKQGLSKKKYIGKYEILSLNLSHALNKN